MTAFAISATLQRHSYSLIAMTTQISSWTSFTARLTRQFSISTNGMGLIPVGLALDRYEIVDSLDLLPSYRIFGLYFIPVRVRLLHLVCA
mmetsp:Transcript_24700/g.58622  ORF Transcript_24700/g.58622 Transcript_24700/m.58622 type:complete len:90 (+) Transcript_24700:59-328(+)